jgi:hypothetical protein
VALALWEVHPVPLPAAATPLPTAIRKLAGPFLLVHSGSILNAEHDEGKGPRRRCGVGGLRMAETRENRWSFLPNMSWLL